MKDVSKALTTAPETRNHDDPPRVLRCAACGFVLTRDDEAIAVNGRHRRVVCNPAGMVFEICCFRNAPGLAARGPASGEFSWFSGCVWQIALCRKCGAQAGWRFSGPDLFFALIAGRFVSG